MKHVIIKAIGFLSVLIPAAVPCFVSYYIYTKGPTPEKYIELHKSTIINPMNDLATLGKDVSLSLKIRNQSTDNFVIVREWLYNSGNVPILPNDYFEKISINVQKPWKILAVENIKESPRSIIFKWNKINDYRFEAEPALLNPGDVVLTNIYCTYTDNKKQPSPAKSTELFTEWHARIVNMPDFKIIPEYYFKLSKGPYQNQSYLITVFLYDWNLACTIILAALFLTIYIHLLHKSELLSPFNYKSILWIVGSGLLCFAAAESTTSYLVPNMYIKAVGINHFSNAPWIVLHFSYLTGLFLTARKKNRQPLQ